MANEEHLARLRQGVEVWNQWRAAHRDIQPDLTGADLRKADLRKIDLILADLTGADLSEADLSGADLGGAALSQAHLTDATLIEAELHEADLTGADLRGADLLVARLRYANLTGAVLSEATLIEANLTNADPTGANLRGADLRATLLIDTIFERADLRGSLVYAVAVWNVNLIGAHQSDLVITPPGQPEITVDNLEVAQFIYLLLDNKKIREVIDTITAKAVLILGRFTPKRKAVLNAMREELRRQNYLPILFDFDGPGSRDFTETISTLAHMARFVIADLTEPSSLPKELEAIVPTLAVPIQPVLEGATSPYSMFQDYWKYHWVLKVYRYENLEELIASLGDRVIAPAEAKVQELEETRRAIAEELLKPRPG